MENRQLEKWIFAVSRTFHKSSRISPKGSLESYLCTQYRERVLNLLFYGTIHSLVVVRNSPYLASKIMRSLVEKLGASA